MVRCPTYTATYPEEMYTRGWVTFALYTGGNIHPWVGYVKFYFSDIMSALFLDTRRAGPYALTIMGLEFVTPEEKREAFPERAAASATKKVTISVPVDEDGHPQWDKAKDKVTARFRELVADPNTQAFLGEAQAIPISPFLSKALLEGFFQIEALFFAARYKLTVAEANEVFKLTEEEHEKINPALESVLSKRGPEFLRRFGDEISLGFLLVNATQAKFAAGKQLVAEKRAAAKDEAAKVPTDGGVKVEGALPYSVSGKQVGASL